ncbi:CNNM domain-containing protein [Micromonospora sp. M12]
MIVVGLLLIILLTAATGYFVAQEFGYVAVDRGSCASSPMTATRPPSGPDRHQPALLRTLRRPTRHHRHRAAGRLRRRTVSGGGLADLLGVAGVSEAVSLPLSVALALVIATIVQMVLGELAPKNLAIARAEQLARALSRSTSSTWPSPGR